MLGRMRRSSAGSHSSPLTRPGLFICLFVGSSSSWLLFTAPLHSFSSQLRFSRHPVPSTFPQGVIPSLFLPSQRDPSPHLQQEVSLAIERTTSPVTVAFKSAVALEGHWAEFLGLPSHIRFELVHKSSGRLVFRGDSNAANKVELPVDMTFVGETYTLQTMGSSTVQRSSCDFIVRGAGEAQEVTMVLERAVGEVQVPASTAFALLW